MGQSEIFDLLRDKRLCGDLGYFSVEQIRKFLNDKGLPHELPSVNNSIGRLRLFNYLDEKVKVTRGRNKVPYNSYRLKREYA